MMTLGFNMEGTEERFEHWLAHAFGGRCTHAFNYLEIGVADCRTFFSVVRWVQNMATQNWACIGTDVFPGPYFDPAKFVRECPVPCRVGHQPEFRLSALEGIMGNGATVVLNTSLAYAYPFLNFSLIDGCHGKKCVCRDFLSIDKAMHPGGIVAFHDACAEDQGGPIIQHCGAGIGVRLALQELDLSPESERFRQGWQFLEEVHGDKRRNGNGFVFVQKL